MKPYVENILSELQDYEEPEHQHLNKKALMSLFKGIYVCHNQTNTFVFFMRKIAIY